MSLIYRSSDGQRGKGTPPSIFWDTLLCYDSLTTGHDRHCKKIAKYRLWS